MRERARESTPTKNGHVKQNITLQLIGRLYRDVSLYNQKGGPGLQKAGSRPPPLNRPLGPSTIMSIRIEGARRRLGEQRKEKPKKSEKR